MSKSYRIRTEPGVDKSLNVQIEQDFEYLEILSLKLLQSEIYTRQCSDYGVIIGRVSVNNGFGIPNAKVSIFIPLESEDEENPIISELYPYKTLNDVNEDGYRYNLLPYKNSYNGHRATGTFFDRNDVLVDPNLIEVFDKYYKYTATTNDSGDFMLFGVPVGSHQIVMDVDLSDIGEFSLSPQDLIRMGIATEQEVAGTNFKVGENLRALPQIVNINKTIQVEPLWGQEDLCNLGINRTDFDLSGESNIDIRPTSVFMGSIISSPDDSPVRRNCKPKGKLGYLCNLTTNSGEILAIRQTIFQDEDGRPILESVDLDQGGLVIDENGTWLLDVPMNLDYVTTNEFGEKVISNDPKIGIPTSGKYRFKVKWGQTPTLSEPVKRGYFLVPNVKEYGWNSAGSSVTNSTDAANSYAFSLDWGEYGDVNTPTGLAMIQEAIDCEDRFYPMVYNKVYTVSQFIDEQRAGSGIERYVGIKNILDGECDSTNNKFPTNDGNLRFDILYIIFAFISIILTPIFFALVILLHLLYFTIWLLRVALIPLLILWAAVKIVNYAILIVGTIPYALGLIIGYAAMIILYVIIGIALGLLLAQLWKMELKGISLPLLTYPDCKMCDCSDTNGLPPEETPDDGEYEVGGLDENEFIPCETIVVDDTPVNQLYLGTSITQLSTTSAFKYVSPTDSIAGPSGVLPLFNPSIKEGITSLLAGNQYIGGDTPSPSGIGAPTPIEVVYPRPTDNEKVDYRWYHTLSLPIADRVNLFNTKAKYFNQNAGYGNPGGGVNRVKVKFNPTVEPGKFHYDNTIILICNKSTLSRFSPGQLLSFQNPSYSKDINVNGLPAINDYGNNSVTGSTKTGVITGTTGNLDNPGKFIIPSVTVNWSRLDGSGNDSTTYNNVSQPTGDTQSVDFHKFPTDIEYFQVITSMTYDEFNTDCVPQLSNSLNVRYLNNTSRIYNTATDPLTNLESVLDGNGFLYGAIDSPNNIFLTKPIDNVRDTSENIVLILNRGVDPYSLPTEIEYDLSLIFGYNNYGNKKVSGNYRLNIPINGKFKNVSHKSSDLSNSNVSTDTYSSQKLYHDSFLYQPSLVSYPVPFPDGSGVPGATIDINIGEYSGFSSNTISYYSSLDNNSTAYRPDCGFGSTPPPVSTYGYVNGAGLKVSPNNKFTREWDTTSVTGPPPYGSRVTLDNTSIINSPTSPTLNRGYFQNEIVEGSSLMGTNMNSGPDFHTTQTFYYSPIYNTTGNTLDYTLGGSDNQIVMRGDRLPISTVPTEFCCNAAPLQKNPTLAMYLIPSTGVVGVSSTQGSATGAGNDSFDDFDNATANIEAISSIIQSFTCENSAPLDCYNGDSGNMVVEPYPAGCYKSGGKRIFKGGCYIFVTRVFLSLIKDLEMLPEWISRNMIALAACRNVYSHRFNNNWINGTLFAFPFSNDVFFTSPTSSNPNQPISNYCRKNIYLDDTFNFYYRSSPYHYAVTPKFVGDVDGIKYPTTMMDLGPINAFIQEIVLSDDYDGYIVNKLKETSYGEVDNILNLFVISRLINSGFLRNVLGSLNILGYFSRYKLSFDGDYSQIISISSELGVAPFQASNYPDNPPGYQNPIFFNDANSNSAVMGIFFSSNTQTRDYISPKRQILNPFTSVVDGCSFNDINVFSQVIPMYQWYIDGDADNGGIFGNQENTWKKSQLDTVNNSGLFSYRYQDLDRLNPLSRYFRTNGGSNYTNSDKGYIYSVSGDTDLDIDESTSNWDLNVAGTDAKSTEWVTVGGPFHFYFGLRQGGSAFDRFRQKFINTEIIID
tara:strand:- start:673 stop:6012 length:5340 start_codon:yes stop_codon:yes gene_type:complete